MNSEKEKNKSEAKNTDEKKKQVLSRENEEDQKEDKETTLAKRSGQRPALLFNRKKMNPHRREEK